MYTDRAADNETVFLDPANACVWRNGQRRPLRAKDNAVLRHLSAHPGELVSKEALLKAAWGDTHVVEAVLKDCVARLRRALGDSARTPCFIETVHGRGYRLLRELLLRPAEAAANGCAETALPAPPAWLVGREATLQQLHAWLQTARQGQRQVGFISGEAGLGKTTVVDAFVQQVAARTDVQVLRGQCVAPYGQGEAYLPLFEALYALCHASQAADRLDLLSRYAPSWLLHLPGLLSPTEREALRRQSPGAGRERMQREFAEAIEALGTERCVVLVPEDLHWSDVATLDLVTLLAQRREPARLLILGTFRPEDLLASDHPLQAVLPTLRRQPQVDILTLPLLTEADVTAYLTVCFPTLALPLTLTPMLYQRSEGNPLFLVTLLDYLAAQSVLDQTDNSGTLQSDAVELHEEVPDTLQQVIMQRQTLCSPEEQQVLAVASVAGLTFSAASVAAGLEADLIETEMCCEGLAQRGLFLQPQGDAEWPDGTLATQYGFRHALYQQVLYDMDANRGLRIAEWETAEDWLQKALAAARQRQSRMHELRAAMSLARLWQRQGQVAAARDLLAPIYSWFTEGFETVVLREARALLDELA